MNALITGANGFIGQKLTSALEHNTSYAHLTLTDILPPLIPQSATVPVTIVKADLTNPLDCATLITPDLDVIFLLHGVMSSTSESNFELGMSANFESTKGLLETIRRVGCKPGLKIVYASSLAVFGGQLPELVTEKTMPTPMSLYGCQKVMCEYLINNYSRRGWVDGRILRFPTVVVRPGAPSGAASSFVSGIIREPLNNRFVTLPVDREMELWVCSPRNLVENVLHAVQIPAERFRKEGRQVNIPGITVTVQEMLQALEEVGGKDRLALIEEKKDEEVQRIVGSWPVKFDLQLAKKLGFRDCGSFSEAVREYVEEEGVKLDNVENQGYKV